MNYTRPGRLHLIINREMIYATLWLRGSRYHFCSRLFPDRGSHDFEEPAVTKKRRAKSPERARVAA